MPDPEHHWGSTSCQTCTSTQCFGYNKSVLIDVTDSSALKELQQPPPTMLKGYFKNDDCKYQRRLLTVEECKIWLEHLKTIVENRKRHTKKAAATVRSKKVGVVDRPHK